MTACYLQRV